MEEEKPSEADRLFKYFLSYILLLVFIVVSVASMTDAQLLLSRQGMTLPFVSISTSIPGFFVISSALVAASSIFVAREFYSFERKKRTGITTSNTLFSYTSNQIRGQLFGTDGKIDRLTFSLISRLVFFYSGPIVCGLLIFRFADFQDRVIFTIQLVLFGFVIYFSFLYDRRTERLHSSQKSRIEKIIWSVAGGLVLLKLLVCIDVMFLAPKYSPVFKIKLHTSLLDDHDGGTVSLVPHIKIDRAEQIWKQETQKQLEEYAYFAGLRDEKQLFLSRGIGLDIRGRRLRFIDLSFQIIPRIWAHDADLSGANLTFAALVGSNFINTAFYGTNFSLTRLDGSRFFNNNFEWTSWNNTQVRGAIFDNATFRRVTLSHTRFLGSSFFGGRFTDSDIFDVDFGGIKIDGMIFRNNSVVAKEAKSVFGMKPESKAMIEEFRKIFIEDDNAALGLLVAEFCSEKLSAADSTALYTMVSREMLLSPDHAKKIGITFKEKKCQAAATEWHSYFSR